MMMKKQLFLLVPWLLVLATSPWLSTTENSSGQKTAVSLRIKTDIQTLTSIRPFRNFENPASLDKAADYIYKKFKTSTPHVFRQYFIAEQKGFSPKRYQNIIASFGPQKDPRLIIGAHYDVCGNQPGADDNASGVAVILELARQLKLKENLLPQRVELVAYALEEPPFFRTQFMGSAIHAQDLAKNNIKVSLMISVDMVGYFNKNSREDPYLSTYIKPGSILPGQSTAIVAKKGDEAISYRVKTLMMKQSNLHVLALNLPIDTHGIDFSDHLNYWNHHYPALLLSNYPVCLNPFYHHPGDTSEKLDTEKIAEIVQALLSVTLYFPTLLPHLE